ncbi:hypothetical protein EPU39_21415 [Escherichia coli]|nr:hypothetical protein EPU39_21415 [Escherichia coli]
MSQITSPATYSISRPQDVIDIVNKNSAINTSIGVIFIALGGILIDAYQRRWWGLVINTLPLNSAFRRVLLQPSMHQY